MANDVADYTSSVVIQSGSVTIAGTATVQITGTPTVNIGNTPTVVIGAGTAAIGSINIGNSPTVVIGAGTAAIGSVSISAGTVTIANASIGVINAAGTKITSSRPPLLLGTVTSNPNPHSVNFALSADIQAIAVVLGNPLSQYVHVALQFPGPTSAVDWIPLQLFSFNQQVYIVPILPQAFDEANNSTNLIQATVQATGLTTSIAVWALFESAPEWLTLFPQPQLEPNQPPLLVAFGSGLTGAPAAIAKGASGWIIAPSPNIQITLFEVELTYAAYSAPANFIFIAGHGTVLPGVTPTAASSLIDWGSSSGVNPAAPFVFPFHGAQLPRGEGLWVNNYSNATGDLIAAFMINYSLS